MSGQAASCREQAIVVSASRRHAVLSPDGVTLIEATSAVKALDITVGDRVVYRAANDSKYFIHEIVPRRNCVSRSYRGETRAVVANVDHLFIVAAVLPLFNTLSIDRIASVAHSQNIPATLLVNKVDLGVESTARLIDVYSALNFRVLLTSALRGEGLPSLREILAQPEYAVVALAGVSGVGKSTFLNQLIPGTEQRTSSVSERTGSGKQTTTQPCGFLYQRQAGANLLIVDLPGIQHFGVSHLTAGQVLQSFPEIVEHSSRCQFSDCGHVYEEDCAVKKAVEQGEIADCRFQSYLHMLDEIESAREY